MNLIELRNKVQEEAVDKWVANNGLGSIVATQAFGKAILMYKSFYKALSLGWIKLEDTIFIFSYTNQQGLNLKKEAHKFLSIFGLNPLEDFNLEYHCYQGLPKGNRVFDVYDELDICISPILSKNLTKSPARYKLGLTGTENAGEYVFREEMQEVLDSGFEGNLFQSDLATQNGEVTKFITKGQFLEIYLPVIFRYDRTQALKDGIIANMQTTIIEHNLAKAPSNIQLRKTKKPKEVTIPLVSEHIWYFSKKSGIESIQVPKRVKGILGRNMSKFLFNLPSKVNLAKQIVDKIEGKTIIFGQRLALLSMITPYVITSKSAVGFTYRNVYYDKVDRTREGIELKIPIKKHLLQLIEKEITLEEYNKVRQLWLNERYETDYLLDAFNKGEITVIASAKAIGRGMTLDNATNGLIVSFGKTNTEFSQKVARLWRLDNSPNKIANLYIIRCKGTYEEEVWFEEMQLIRNKKKQVIGKMDLNIIKTIPSQMLQIKNFKL